jgi:DNA modification methylase/ParB-like chromosome segregation protein Spo0J
MTTQADTRFTALMPPLPDEDFQALKRSIREHGLMIPIVRDEYGTIIDGGHRQRAIDELRAEGVQVHDLPYDLRYGLSEDAKRILARQMNLARRHLSVEQRRQVIEQQLRETPQLSDRKIGRSLHVDGKTVGAVRAQMEETAEIPQFDSRMGADGRARPARRAARAKCALCGEPVEEAGRTSHEACELMRAARERAAAEGPLERRDRADVAPHHQLKLSWCFICGGEIELEDVIPEMAGRDGLRHPACGNPEDNRCARCGGAVKRSERRDEGGNRFHAPCWTDRAQEAPPPPPTPSKPILATARQMEKVRELADAQALKLVASKGINGAHKHLREERRLETLRRQVAMRGETGPEARIVHADVFDLLAEFEDESVDLVWTDPPYNIASYGGGTKVGDRYTSFDPGDWDKRDEEEFLAWLRRLVGEFDRVLRPTGSLVCCMDRALISDLWRMCRLRGKGDRVGLKPRNILTWEKSNAAPNARGNFDSSIEMAVWAPKGAVDGEDGVVATFQRPRSGRCPSQWSGSFVSGPTRREWPHPTPKPVGWIQYHIEILTVPGQLVLDPFGGSGSTLEAALSLGRRVVTGDLNPDYCAMMRERCAAVVEQLGSGVVA